MGGMRPTVYRRNARGLRDRQALEHVRMQTGEPFAARHSQAKVARQLGVARQTSAAGTPADKQAGCRAAAQRRVRPAPPPRLSDQQSAAIDQALRQDAHVYGFDTHHGTLACCTTVIEQLSGLGFHRAQVWRLLRHRMAGGSF
jgi:transposase